MSYVLEFSEHALEDIEKHKKVGDQSVLRKLKRLFSELQKHPTTGTGQPEKLKHELAGLYSRRINRQHRLVYSIKEEIVTVYVLSAWSHYGDK
ncbi:MAG: Txe/YoeB family addiction module toxin [Cytophagales bacterium]|nr:Txe/YoeB family addiction module toxin [Cytophagales bacterium]